MSGLDSQPLRSLQSRWRFFTLIVALGFFVAACGTDDSGDATNTVGAGETVTSTPGQTTTTGAPERFQGQLAGLTVIDENTFTVELYEANAEFPLLLFFPQFLALPDSAFVDPVAQNEMPIGNGPFMMAGPWEHGVRIMAVSYPDYEGDPAKVDSYEWVLHLSPEAAYSDTLAGDVDVMPTIPDDFFDSAPDDFGATCMEIDYPNIVSLQIQVDLEQYAKEHRRALSMAIERRRWQDLDPRAQPGMDLPRRHPQRRRLLRQDMELRSGPADAAAASTASSPAPTTSSPTKAEQLNLGLCSEGIRACGCVDRSRRARQFPARPTTLVLAVLPLVAVVRRGVALVV